MMGHTAESVTIAANRTLARDGYLQSGASDDLDDNAPNPPRQPQRPASMDEARRHRPAGAPETEEGDEAEEAEWDEPRRDAGRWAVKSSTRIGGTVLARQGCLGRLSRAVSSPFQQRAMEEGLHYVGGKHDDISVVVAVVGDPSERLTRGGFSVRSGPRHGVGFVLSTESHGAGQLSA
ncbi:hypothetical protein L1887_54387 [Cichorium endivia]|nr:hypothetical protein L1887_54387 [Cichorium endivia]